MARQYSPLDDDRPRWGTTDPRPDARGDGFAEARLGREIEDLGRTSGREVHEGFVRNFLPESERRTWSESVEERAEARRRIMAARPDPHAERGRQADLVRSFDVTISGTATTSRGRFDTEGFVRSIRRDPQSGRIVIAWEKVNEYGEGG